MSLYTTLGLGNNYSNNLGVHTRLQFRKNLLVSHKLFLLELQCVLQAFNCVLQPVQHRCESTHVRVIANTECGGTLRRDWGNMRQTYD